MPRVDIPKVGVIDFPDSMSEEDINKAAKKLYDQAAAPPKAEFPTKKIYSIDEIRANPKLLDEMDIPGVIRKRTWAQAASDAPMTLGAAGAIAGPGGAALGGIAGKSIDIISKSLQGEQKYAGVGGALKGLKEELTSGFVQGALDLTLGLVTKTLAKPAASYAERYARPSQAAAREGFKEAGEEASALKKVGPKITEQDITVHNVTNALQKSFNELGPRKALSEAGVAVKDAIETGESNFHAIYNKEYETLNKIARDQVKDGKGFVDALTVKKRFKALTTDVERKAAQAAPESLGLHEYAANIKSDIENLNSVDFDVAHKMRSEWLTKARESGSAEAVKYAKRAAKAMDWGMEEAAKNIGSDFYQTWRSLNSSYKDGIRKFEGTYIEGLMKRSPEDLVKSLRPEQATKATMIRDALLEYGGGEGQQAWSTFQRSYAEQLFRNPASLKKSLESAGENLDVVFNDVKGQALRGRMERMAEAIDVAREVDPRILGNLHEGVRMGGLGYLGMRLGNAVDQAGAYMYVKIAESEGATRLMIDALKKAPKDYAAATANLARVLYMTQRDKMKKSSYQTPAEQLASP